MQVRGRRSAASTTAKIASKPNHKARTSLLSGESAYEQLPGTSFSSVRPIIPSERFAPGGYHDREGLNTTNVTSKRKCKVWAPDSTWTWTFALIALIQAAVALCLEAYVFARFSLSVKEAAYDDPNAPKGARTIPTYLALFIFGFIYQLVLVWDALRMKNTIQVVGICLYNFGMLVYSSVCVNQVDDAVYNLGQGGDIDPGIWAKLRPFLIAAPAVIALGTVLLSLVAWKLYDEFAWNIYKNISADLRLKRRFLTYQIYIALLKFDFFFFLGFTVQFLVVVVSDNNPEFWLTIAAVPVTIALLILAAVFIRRESYSGQSGIIIVYFGAMAYFVFKLVRMYDSSRAPSYEPARNSLTTFAVLTILCLVVTIATAFICMRNFNKGLRPYVQSRRNNGESHDTKYAPYGDGHFRDASTHQLNRVQTRMEID